jgi:predicted transcriptional regulator
MTPAHYRQIEQRLQTARIPLAEFCRAAEISRVSWYNWVRGDHEPNVRTWRRVEAAMRKLDV